jgi:hypothetical protein
MSVTATTHPAQASDDAVRLRMDPQPSRENLLDGGWWPRSADAVTELPSLVKALGESRGEITHVLLNAGEWDLPHPRRTMVGSRALRLGWFTAQPAGLVTIMSDFGNNRFDLLVVPSGTSRDRAETALSAAADPADKRHAPELLAEAERA